MLDLAMQDLRYALRTMRRNAGFTTVAVVTLALGIGANTVVFSLVHTVLLRPLPYQAPDRLVAVWNRWNGVASAPLSDPEFLDYSERSGTMTLAASAGREVNVGGTTGDPERVFAAFVTANTFDVLGVTPALGRGFRAGEDTAGHDVAIISDSLWRRRFAASPLGAGSVHTAWSGRRGRVVFLAANISSFARAPIQGRSRHPSAGPWAKSIRTNPSPTSAR